jgi:hypothetical protein
MDETNTTKHTDLGSPEEDWNKEIAKRIAELDSGEVRPVSWEDARSQIFAILHGRQAAG